MLISQLPAIAETRMANSRFEHERSMEREQRRFDRLILAGVFILYAALIIYGMWTGNAPVHASGITGLVSVEMANKTSTTDFLMVAP